VFDVTRKITYKNLKKWYGEMRKHCPKIPCILIANKIDSNLNLHNILLSQVKPEVTSTKFGFA
jgi:Rab-like protein 2